MNDAQKQAKEYAEILLAFSRGEAVEAKTRDCTSAKWFVPVKGPHWDFILNEYRIAPKPVEEWRWLFSTGQTSSVYPNKESLIDIFRNTDGRPVLMREVTE